MAKLAELRRWLGLAVSIEPIVKGSRRVACALTSKLSSVGTQKTKQQPRLAEQRH